MKKSIDSIRSVKYNAKQKESSWIPVSNGFLKIGHKPGGKKRTFQTLKNENTDTILTILGEQEGAKLIGELVQSLEIDWIWLALRDGKIPPKKMSDEIFNILNLMKTKLEKGEKIYIHCSAGLHRTGMITYALLLLLGFNTESAFEVLKQLRPITAMEVGKHRLKWSKNLIQRYKE